MRIVIDLQGAQTGSRFRGIGRYTTALTRGLLRNAGEHEVWLVLNSSLSESIAAIRADFAGLIPQERICLFKTLAPVSDLDPRFEGRTQAAEMIREHFIARLRPDAVLVSSLFESYFEHAVVSAGRFTDAARTAVMLYDLIPYLNPEAYLASPLARTLYMAKIDSLKRAGLLLAISNYARTEAIDALTLDASRVVAISTAVDETFLPRQMAPDEVAILTRQFGITRAMLMYAPGGYDQRKNLNGLISAYALLPLALRDKHQLIIASRLTERNRADLTAHARASGLRDDELVLTGYISDRDLIGLYQCASLFIFPSLHEGFGLPALEAMACGAPVIGSNSTSLPEVIGLAEAMFDPSSPPAIAAKIVEVLGDPAMLARLRVHGRTQAARFSWDATAQRTLRALEARAACAGPAPAAPGQAELAEALAQVLDLSKDKDVLLELAFCMAALPEVTRHPRLLADMTSYQGEIPSDAHPVILSHAHDVWHYRTATGPGQAGAVADLHTGDVVIHIDIADPAVMLANAAGLYRHLHRLGVELRFAAGKNLEAMVGVHAPAWMTLLAGAETVTCNSESVARALRSCLGETASALTFVIQDIHVERA